MRRIVMFNHVSADGYFSGADGNLNWIVPDEEIDKDAVERMPTIDTILLGRRTYELFEAFWPDALDESSSTPPSGITTTEGRQMNWSLGTRTRARM